MDFPRRSDGSIDPATDQRMTPGGAASHEDATLEDYSAEQGCVAEERPPLSALDDEYAFFDEDEDEGRLREEC